MLELIKTRPKGKAEDVKQSRARSKEKPMSKVESCLIPEPQKHVKETMEPKIRTVEPMKETTVPVKEKAETVKETTKPVKEKAKTVKETTISVKETMESVKETAKPVKHVQPPVTELNSKAADVSNNTMFILFIYFNIDILILLILAECCNNGEL